jgi:hypothetical protein
MWYCVNSYSIPVGMLLLKWNLGNRGIWYCMDSYGIPPLGCLYKMKLRELVVYGTARILKAYPVQMLIQKYNLDNWRDLVLRGLLRRIPLGCKY